MIAPKLEYNRDVRAIRGITDIWRETLGDSNICIALLDGPVDQTHPSLLNADLTQIETLVSNVADSGFATQHGTHIASIIFAQHERVLAGIAPRCRGLITPIFQSG